MNFLIKILVLLCLLAGTTLSVRAQAAAPPPLPAYQLMGDAQLDQLLGPIALYPDPLIAQILPASTLPTQIVLADRYVTGGGDPNQIDQQPWDASVQALARYPTVLKWMDDNLNWTTELGQAFLNQQSDVMASIQRLRASANNLGNLPSTPQQQVVNDGGDIEIVPADPQVIYVPVYQPDQVYYQSDYGPPFITFGIGWPVGVWLDCDFDWGNRNLVYWNRGYPRPNNWWHEPPGQRNWEHTGVWRPASHPGAVAASRGDRGWNNYPASRPSTPAYPHPEPARQLSQPNGYMNSVPPRAPAPVEYYPSVSRSQPDSAFIGIQSPRETRTYSNRGQQSIQTTTHSAPASRPAQSGGGGSHGGEVKH